MSRKFERAWLQNEAEAIRFIEILKAEGVRSYLEIGSKFGGMLWRVGISLPRDSRIASIDLPHGDGSFKETLPHLVACVAALKARGYDAHLHLGDSTAPEAIAFATSLAPFDCIFIDANHTEPYVRKDWANYGPLGRMVAFHDINFKRDKPIEPPKMPIDVPKVWAELKGKYRHTEIKCEVQDNGIGVLWRS